MTGHVDPIELAISRRLRRLAAMPVDLTAFDARLEAHGVAPPRRTRRFVWVSRLAAIAAGLMITAMVIFALVGSERPASAAASDMAQLHQELVSGKTPVAKAASIAEANALIAAMAEGKVIIPEVPAMHTMACCMRSVQNKSVACVLLQADGIPVTMAVAKATELRATQGDTLVRNGHTFRVERIGALSMVTTERGGQWVCLIGQLPAERLADMASGIKF